MDKEKYKFNCEKCNYHTNISSSYTKHISGTFHNTGKRKIRSDRKQQEDIYRCNKCDYNSINEYNYKAHYLNNHGTREDKKKEFKYYCEICDFGTFIEQTYTAHVKTKKHKIKSL